MLGRALLSRIDAHVSIARAAAGKGEQRKQALLDEQPLGLTAFEYRILEYLMRHHQQVVAKDRLMEQLYPGDEERDPNVIEVLVGRLRRKLEGERGFKPIDTVRGLADDIHAAHGSLDVLMNIAGISVWGRVEDLRHEHWRKVIEINLMGPIHVIECFVPAMIEAGLPETGYAMGADFTVADAALFYVFFWASKTDIALPPRCQALFERLRARPVVHQVLREEGYR